MTFEEVVALVTALSKAVSGVTDQLAAHDAKIAKLEQQVQDHVLQTPLPPGPPPPQGA